MDMFSGTSVTANLDNQSAGEFEVYRDLNRASAWVLCAC